MTAFTKENAARGTDLGGIEGDQPGRRIEGQDNPTGNPAQHSRRDHYRLQVAPAWELPGADAFRILDLHWGRR